MGILLFGFLYWGGGGGGGGDFRNLHMSACLCACVRACVRPCVRECVRACVRACVRGCVCVCVCVCFFGFGVGDWLAGVLGWLLLRLDSFKHELVPEGLQLASGLWAPKVSKQQSGKPRLLLFELWGVFMSSGPLKQQLPPENIDQKPLGPQILSMILFLYKPKPYTLLRLLVSLQQTRRRNPKSSEVGTEEARNAQVCADLP